MPKTRVKEFDTLLNVKMATKAAGTALQELTEDGELGDKNNRVTFPSFVGVTDAAMMMTVWGTLFAKDATNPDPATNEIASWRFAACILSENSPGAAVHVTWLDEQGSRVAGTQVEQVVWTIATHGTHEALDLQASYLDAAVGVDAVLTVAQVRVVQHIVSFDLDT